MKTHKKRTRFTAMATVLVVAVAGLIGFTVWFAYHSSQAANANLKSANKVSSDIPKLPQIKTFADCQKAAGSKTQQTYPEQCVTKAGKSFTDTTQPKYLVVKEWGVELPYTGTDSFTYASKTTSNAITVVSSSLAKTYGCTSYGAGTVSRGHGSDLAYIGIDGDDGETIAQVYTSHPGNYVKVGSYYYSFTHDQAECNDAPLSLQNKANDTVKAAVTGIRAIP